MSGILAWISELNHRLYKKEKRKRKHTQRVLNMILELQIGENKQNKEQDGNQD